MEHNTKDASLMGRKRIEEFYGLQMGPSLKVIFKITKLTVKANTHGPMEKYMWDNGSAIKCMGMASYNGLMVKGMKAISKTINATAKASSSGKTAEFTMDSGRTANNTGEVSISKWMALRWSVNGVKVSVLGGSPSRHSKMDDSHLSIIMRFLTHPYLELPHM